MTLAPLSEPWSCFIAYQSTRDGPTSLCNQAEQDHPRSDDLAKSRACPERSRREPTACLCHHEPRVPHVSRPLRDVGFHDSITLGVLVETQQGRIPWNPIFRKNRERWG